MAEEPQSKVKGFLSKLVVPLATALLLGGTAPWWYQEFFKKAEPQPVTQAVKKDEPEPKVQPETQPETQPKTQPETQSESEDETVPLEPRPRDGMRSSFEAIPLRQIAPDGSVLIGSDPRAVAFDAFGIQHLEEGGSPSSEPEIEHYDGYAVVSLVSSTGGDDSVRGSRYRLEFEPIDDRRWQLVWAGQQWQCYRGDDAGQWTTKLCI